MTEKTKTNWKTITIIIMLGSIQVAYDIVSWKPFLVDRDIKVSRYFHDRYEAMMQQEQTPQMLRVAALTEVLDYAPVMCGNNKTCEGTMKQMEK